MERYLYKTYMYAPLAGALCLLFAHHGDTAILGAFMLAIAAWVSVGYWAASRDFAFDDAVEAALPTRAIAATLTATFAAPARIRRFAQRDRARHRISRSTMLLSRMPGGTSRRHAGRQSGASVARRSASGAKSGDDSDGGDGGDGGGEPPHWLGDSIRCTFGGAA